MTVAKYKREILTILLFLLVAFGSISFNHYLPDEITGDEVITLLVDKSAKDINFPDRELISSMDYDTYWYNKILPFLDAHFSTEIYNVILLFVYVFLTGYGAYLALKILRLSYSTSIGVALAALLPRLAPGLTFFGVFTSHEITGRSLALPFIWILTALNIRRLYEQQKIWPIFFLAGLLVYIHPVSMIFFSSLMFIISFILLFRKSNFKKACREIFYSIIAFAVSASWLIRDVLLEVNSLFTKANGVVYSSQEHAAALFFRMPWDFYQQTFMWLRHVAVVSLFFILFIVLVIVLMKKRRYQLSDWQKHILLWSGLIITWAAFFSLLVPNVQLWLVKTFNLTFIIQQSSRFFKFYYLGLFILFAVFWDIFRQYFKSEILFAVILIVAIMSSSLGFEWTQYLLGYNGYEKAYIFTSLQVQERQPKELRYNRICLDLADYGITRDALIISYDFDLRYFCGLKLYTTYEEGTFYLMRSNDDLVAWYQMFQEQNKVLSGESTENLILFADRIKADYAVIDKNTALVRSLADSNLVYQETADVVVIKFKD